MKFLRQLLGRDSNPAILAAPVSGELCQVLPAQSLGSNAQLYVETGQNALIFNGEKRSNLYPTGEHRLDAQELRGIVDGGEANVLFLQIAPPVKRAWQTAYRPDGGQPLILSGHYTAAVEDARLLTAALLDGGNMPDNRVIDAWLHQYIRRILTDQRVPAADFQAHTGKLAVFLHDALIPFLLDHGIRLQNFSLDVENPAQGTVSKSAAVSHPAATPKRSIPPQQFPARTAPAMTPSLALQAALAAGKPQPQPAPPPDTSPQAAALDTRDEAPVFAGSDDNADADTFEVPIGKASPPKIFYRLEKGEQVGPYNIDELNHMIAQGKIRPSDLLWHQGLKSWQRAADFSGLQW